MNKKLVAVAIAGVLAAPLAQAQTANVTLYGRLNLDREVIINAKQDSHGPWRASTAQAEPLPGELELVALRRARHRSRSAVV